MNHPQEKCGDFIDTASSVINEVTNIISSVDFSGDEADGRLRLTELENQAERISTSLPQTRACIDGYIELVVMQCTQILSIL